MTYIQPTSDGVILAVRVQPGAKRNAVDGIWHGTHVKIALNAPAVDGKANDALIDFLSNLWGVRKSAITILSGYTARTKRLQILGISVDDVIVG